MRRKGSRNTYVIFALICLIVFNIGTILIKSMGNKAKFDKDNRTKTVFSYEKPEIGYQEVFSIIFSRTSSIINLYNIQESPNSNIGNYLNKNLDIGSKFSNFFRAQFPSFLSLNRDAKPVDKEKLDESDMEGNPTIIEDFIIIDRLEEYEDLIIINDSEGNISLENVPKPLNIKPLKIDKEKPYILLYHTHGTESYSSNNNDKHHTTDRRYNVTTIGEYISKALEAKGHNIEHIAKYHDIPSYSKSYSESLKTVNQKLKENNNFKILLDVHRDGFDPNEPSIKKNMKNILAKTRTKINGKDVATFCFVVGPDSPNKDAVLSFAKYIKAVTDVLYPDLCTGIIIKPVGKYNQFLSDYSALIEVGSNLNTMNEAMETAKILGEILNIVIDNIQE